MSAVSVATLAGALLFVGFHVPGPLATGQRAKVVGIGYHLLVLPAVAALPAPMWVKAAGFGWMLFDVAFEGATFAGLEPAIADSVRQGVHVLAAVWVAGAGWAGDLSLTITGTALAVVFCLRTALSGTTVDVPAWVRHLNAVLNVAWLVAVAVALRG